MKFIHALLMMSSLFAIAKLEKSFWIRARPFPIPMETNNIEQPIDRRDQKFYTPKRFGWKDNAIRKDTQRLPANPRFLASSIYMGNSIPNGIRDIEDQKVIIPQPIYISQKRPVNIFQKGFKEKHQSVNETHITSTKDIPERHSLDDKASSDVFTQEYQQLMPQIEMSAEQAVFPTNTVIKFQFSNGNWSNVSITIGNGDTLKVVSNKDISKIDVFSNNRSEINHKSNSGTISKIRDIEDNPETLRILPKNSSKLTIDELSYDEDRITNDLDEPIHHLFFRSSNDNQDEDDDEDDNDSSTTSNANATETTEEITTLGIKEMAENVLDELAGALPGKGLVIDRLVPEHFRHKRTKRSSEIDTSWRHIPLLAINSFFEWPLQSLFRYGDHLRTAIYGRNLIGVKHRQKSNHTNYLTRPAPSGNSTVMTTKYMKNSLNGLHQYLLENDHKKSFVHTPTRKPEHELKLNYTLTFNAKTKNTTDEPHGIILSLARSGQKKFYTSHIFVPICNLTCYYSYRYTKLNQLKVRLPIEIAYKKLHSEKLRVISIKYWTFTIACDPEAFSQVEINPSFDNINECKMKAKKISPPHAGVVTTFMANINKNIMVVVPAVFMVMAVIACARNARWKGVSMDYSKRIKLQEPILT